MGEVDQFIIHPKGIIGNQPPGIGNLVKPVLFKNLFSFRFNFSAGSNTLRMNPEAGDIIGKVPSFYSGKAKGSKDIIIVRGVKEAFVISAQLLMDLP